MQNGKNDYKYTKYKTYTYKIQNICMYSCVQNNRSALYMKAMFKINKNKKKISNSLDKKINF